MKAVLSGWIFLLFTGCAILPNPPENSKHEQLSHMLVERLHVKKKDAMDLSTSVLTYSHGFKERYALVSPPLFHNFLVNIGIKERGLCWHFAYDMLTHLKAQNFETFDYYIGGANINDYWEEHNALVLTCKGCDFQQGVLLDPWRYSGTLFFSPIMQDPTYTWEQRGGLR